MCVIDGSLKSIYLLLLDTQLHFWIGPSTQMSLKSKVIVSGKCSSRNHSAEEQLKMKQKLAAFPPRLLLQSTWA